MKKINRPLSPHLTIYKPQITSVMSISHRIAGIFQSFGLVVFFLLIYTIYLGENVYYLSDFVLDSILGKVFFLMYTFSLFYHLLNGIRHLLWDFGFGFNSSNVTYSGYVIILLAFFSNILLWVCVR